MISVPSVATNGFNVKQFISQADFETLDRIACAADRLHQAVESFFGLADISIEFIRDGQRLLAEAIERLLAIDDWDQDKKRAVREYVNERMPHPVDDLLDHLGVVVTDSRQPTADSPQS